MSAYYDELYIHKSVILPDSVQDKLPIYGNALIPPSSIPILIIEHPIIHPSIYLWTHLPAPTAGDSSVFTAPTFPCTAAACRGVRPNMSRGLGPVCVCARMCVCVWTDFDLCLLAGFFFRGLLVAVWQAESIHPSIHFCIPYHSERGGARSQRGRGAHNSARSRPSGATFRHSPIIGSR